MKPLFALTLVALVAGCEHPAPPASQDIPVTGVTLSGEVKFGVSYCKGPGC